MQDCCSSSVVVTSFDHKSFLYCANLGVFCPYLVTCNSTSFNCCVCLKSCKDRGLFCLEVFGVSKRVSESCGLQGYLFVCVVIWYWLLVELKGFLRTGCSSV